MATKSIAKNANFSKKKVKINLNSRILQYYTNPKNYICPKKLNNPKIQTTFHFQGMIIFIKNIKDGLKWILNYQIYWTKSIKKEKTKNLKSHSPLVPINSTLITIHKKMLEQISKENLKEYPGFCKRVIQWFTTMNKDNMTGQRWMMKFPNYFMKKSKKVKKFSNGSMN